MILDEIIKQVNAMPFMEYDITFCDNDNCSRKANCHRYLMYQTYKADERKDKPLLIYKYVGESENCKMFWEAKEFKL